MGWLKTIAITVACFVVAPIAFKLSGITPKPASPSPPPAAPAKYDLHSDPDYIALTRREAVKLSDMDWKLGGFGTVMIASFTIKNERSVYIKDVIVRCEVSAASGTKIGSPVKTVFQSIAPGKSVKIRDLSMGFVRDAGQANTAICYVEDHSDG